MLLVQSFMACFIQFLGVGSSALFFISGLPLFVALALNAIITKPDQDVSLWAYAIGQLIPLTTGAQMMYGVLEVFVPLVGRYRLISRIFTYWAPQTGRMGKQAPAEHIIATIVAVTGAYALPLAIPFIHRYSRAVLVRSIVIVSVLSTLSIAVFFMREPFDAMHQKRLFVIHMENVSHVSIDLQGAITE